MRSDLSALLVLLANGDTEMQKVNSGERYKDKYTGKECVVNIVYSRGRGYQVQYQFDELAYALITGRGEFLKSFELIAN